MKNLFGLLFFCFLFSTSHAQDPDSLNMTLLATIDPASNAYNDVWGYTTPSGEEYAIIGSRTHIYIVDVSDCSNPVLEYSFAGGDNTTWRDFKTFDTYVYGVCDGCSEGLHIFDMSALPSGNVVHELTTTAFFPESHNIYIDEGEEKLYAVGVPGSTDVTILDLSVTPENPTLIRHLDFNQISGVSGNHYVHDIYVREDTAYVSHGWLGYKVWDVSSITPTSSLNSITELGFMDTGGYNHSSWTTADGKIAYYAEEVPQGLPIGVMDLIPAQTGIGSLDTFNTFADPVPSTTSGIPTPHNPFVHNDTLYISYYEDGIKAYDLSVDPQNPTLIGYYDTYIDNGTTYGGYNGCWGIYPFFDSGCLMASDRSYGLNIIKYQEPPPPLPECDSITAFISIANLVPQDTILASDSILTNTTLLNGNIQYYQAVNSIQINPPFQADAGSELQAMIGPCDASGLNIKEEDQQVEIKKE